jgi:serine/threonine-protein kinase HipA
VVEVLARADSRAALIEALEHTEFESISGVMPKAPAIRSPDAGERLTMVSDEWILKTGRQDTPGIAINEFLCMELAREMGLPVPSTRLSKDGETLAVARFDRDYGHDGAPLGFEDFCSLMGMPPQAKYDATMEGISKHLLLWCGESQRIESARRLISMTVLNLVTRNADAHAKNHAILYSSREDATLAPVFDVVTVAAYPDYALAPFGLAIGGRKTWNLRKELERLSIERFNLAKSSVSDAAERVASGMQKVVPEIGRLAREFPGFRETGKRMSHLWEEGLQQMAGKGGISVPVDFSVAGFSAEKRSGGSRKSKHTMNPEKLG